MGAPEKMKAHAQSRGGRFYRGYRHALRLYRPKHFVTDITLGRDIFVGDEMDAP